MRDREPAPFRGLRRRLLGAGIVGSLAIGLATGLAAAPAPPARRPPAAQPREEFFVISSIDAARQRMVLKRPTEVTLAMRVSARTVYRDEGGKPLRLADLRAGDTAYVTSTRSAAGDLAAVSVRLGPMTVEELQARYLQPARSP